jgi:predicted tellurium resistance membrane protein TerC
MQKDSYSKDRKVLLTGFGTAAVLATLFFLFMSWLAEQVHLAQFSLSRFGH